MEYYILVTKSCNLKCSYCSGIDIGKDIAISKEVISDLCSFLEKNHDENTKNGIVFYGGEPLLAQEEIITIINQTNNLDLDYIIHTNGSLLNKIDPYILENIDGLFVSIDGIPEVNDSYRGKGVFESVISNIEKLRPIFNGVILARITVPIRGYFEYKYSLSESIRNIFSYNIFDSVHWQIENSPFHHDNKIINAFLKGYASDIDNLVDCWIANAQNGTKLDIIPIQTAAVDLLKQKQYINFPCGCGERLVVIDVDGECYLCDELIGREEYKIGNVKEGIRLPKDYHCTKINDNCAFCEYMRIC